MQAHQLIVGEYEVSDAPGQHIHYVVRILNHPHLPPGWIEREGKCYGVDGGKRHVVHSRNNLRKYLILIFFMFHLDSRCPRSSLVPEGRDQQGQIYFLLGKGRLL